MVEDADTFAGNARKKAAELAVRSHCWVLADDSGLAVDALEGAPGVFSARYAGEPSDDAANNAKLLSAIDAVTEAARGAAFHCALALADPIGHDSPGDRGNLPRAIDARDARGAGGFGYDPLFLIREYHKTFGELSPLVKHQLSHRACAFSRLRGGLIRMIAMGELDVARA